MTEQDKLWPMGTVLYKEVGSRRWIVMILGRKKHARAYEAWTLAQSDLYPGMPQYYVHPNQGWKIYDPTEPR